MLSLLNTIYKFRNLSGVLFICILITACEDSNHYAPVGDLNHSEHIPRSGIYKVKPGETLYEISWRYGLDFRFIATKNKIPAPYEIYPGQIIYLKNTAQVKSQPHQNIPTRITSTLRLTGNHQPALGTKAMQGKEPNFAMRQWILPAKGRIVNGFSSSNKGWNISGKLHEPVYATGAGKVVYSGNGLRGYGNLIILKHNSLYLSAYAHNFVNLVHEGDWVTAGQIIAQMGQFGTRPLLHFEIRKAGKSVDPGQLLK